VRSLIDFLFHLCCFESSLTPLVRGLSNSSKLFYGWGLRSRLGVRADVFSDLPLPPCPSFFPFSLSVRKSNGWDSSFRHFTPLVSVETDFADDCIESSIPV